MGCMHKWLGSAKGSQMIKSKRIRQKNFQGQSARAKHWFNLYHEWLKEIFMTRELDFY